MAVPEFFHFIRPTLESLADGEVRHWSELEPVLATRLGLTSQDLAEMLDSGTRTRVADRTQWALTYLRQALLVERAGRGRSRITERGRAYLMRAPEVVRPDDLREFPEFAEFQQRTSRSARSGARDAGSAGADGGHAGHDAHETPDARMESAYAEHQAALETELLAGVKGLTPADFERLIVQLMMRLGYGLSGGAGRVTGGSGDGGIDGVIDEDKLGLDKIYLQAKRWSDATVGRQEVQRFVGALTGHGATKGVFITASQFSHGAEEYAEGLKQLTLSLIDGRRLVQLMAEHDLGVTPTRKFVLKRVDLDALSEG